MNNFNKDYLDVVEARANAATKGPWKTYWHGQQFIIQDGDGEELMEQTYAIATWEPEATEQRAECATQDFNFIAHAREDIPTLVELVRSLYEEIERWQESVTELVADKLALVTSIRTALNVDDLGAVSDKDLREILATLRGDK